MMVFSSKLLSLIVLASLPLAVAGGVRGDHAKGRDLQVECSDLHGTYNGKVVLTKHAGEVRPFSTPELEGLLTSAVTCDATLVIEEVMNFPGDCPILTTVTILPGCIDDSGEEIVLGGPPFRCDFVQNVHNARLDCFRDRVDDFDPASINYNADEQGIVFQASVTISVREDEFKDLPYMKVTASKMLVN